MPLGCQAEVYRVHRSPGRATKVAALRTSDAWRGRMGRAMVRAREAAGRSQIDVAKAIGLNQASLSALERGESVASSATLEAIADYLNCSLDFLTGRQSPETHRPSVSFFDATGTGADLEPSVTPGRDVSERIAVLEEVARRVPMIERILARVLRQLGDDQSGQRPHPASQPPRPGASQPARIRKAK